MSSTNSYKQVFKATGIFGGVQILTILINLIRSKFIAIILGSVGFGIAGLYNTPLAFITTLTSLGIGYSAIRDIAQAYETGDADRLARVITVFKRWIWLTGILGIVVTIIFSKLLSRISFSNDNETLAFVALSVTLLITSVSSGQNAILRGTRKIADTAKSIFYSAVLGLFLTVPLYYLFGIKGIVPAIIGGSLITLFYSWFYSRKVVVNKVTVTWRETWTEGLSMVQLGIMMSLAGLITSGVTYLITVFINHEGSVEAVGLYNAGWSITNQYVSLVFTAMAADYYPRLAGIHHDLVKLREAVNQQAEIAVLILGPFMLLYLLVLPIVIPIILSSQFLAVVPFTRWIVLGMLFKAASWALGFIILAKGESKLFLLTEVLSNILLLVGYISGFYIGGLEGIGVSFVALYFIYLVIMIFISKYRYSFTFSSAFIKIITIQFILSLIAFCLVQSLPYYAGFIGGGICFIISSVHAFHEINKRINIKQLLSKFLKR